MTKGASPVVARQTEYEYLCGPLEVTERTAHFAHLPTVNLDCDAVYLEELAASDPYAVHVVIRDNAGFHLRDGDTRLPVRDRIGPLPPYRPELNPCEEVVDVINDQVSILGQRNIKRLRDALLPSLKRFWEDADAVLRLVGGPCLLDPSNVSDPG